MKQDQIVIDIRKATVKKGSTPLFKDFNFTLRSGEHWVVQGSNGSGKTIFLHLLAGIIAPAEGEVHYSFVQGNDWDTRYQQRREAILFIPAEWIQHQLEKFDDVFYQQRYYSVEETELPLVSDIFGDDLPALKSLAISGNFDIKPLLDLPITRLSNGQLKKVIILRQLVRSIPRVLIMDYPFDGLDADSRKDLNRFLDDIAGRFAIQIVLTDHGHSLPSVINRRLVLGNFQVQQISAEIPDEASASPALSSAESKHTDGEIVVDIQNLNIAYSGRKIISGLDWRIRKGERWALTGKNGSGKTTLFSLIFADHPMAYSESVFLFGKRRGTGESIWDIKNRINYLGPEQIHFLDHRTKAFPARTFIGMQRHANPERLAELIRFFRAEDYIDTPLRLLSSGQLQMVLLMNLFLDDKELLLLDEPFQFLDPENHERVTNYLNHYLDRQVTLVLITHDEKDVARWTQLRKTLQAALPSPDP